MIKAIGVLILLYFVFSFTNAGLENSLDKYKYMSDEAKIKEKDKLLDEVNKLDEFDINENKSLYKKLATLYPNNREFVSNEKYYNKLSSFKTNCEMKIFDVAKKTLKNPSTFKIEKYLKSEFRYSYLIISEFSFSGKNLMGVSQKFNMVTECNDNDDGTYSINILSLD